MKLTIESLTAIGGFAGAPVEKEINWSIGDEQYTATVFIRPLSYRSAVSDIMASSKGDDALAARIATSVCDENGEPIFTAGDITGEADPDRGPLDGSLTLALLAAIGEVSGMGKSKS